MWDLKIDTRRLVEGFSTSVLWERPNVLWNKADDWWNDNYVTDPSTAAFLSATGIIDPNKQNYVNNLVIALKNQGLWNKMKAIYPFVSEQRNLLNNTENFSTTDWIKVGATITANDTLAPNGTMTADKVVFGASANYFYQRTSVIGQCNASIYIKGTAGETISIDNTQVITEPLITLTGEWQRINLTSTTTGSTVQGIALSTYQSATARTIWVWGAQLELGSAPTDYQTTINAQEQFAAAYKYNLKDPQDTDAAFRLKIFGTWTFTPTGAKGNGTNAYMDPGGFNSAANLSLNSAHISYYSRTNSPSSMVMAGTQSLYVLGRWTDYHANNSVESNLGGISMGSTTAGFFMSNRTIGTVMKYQINSTIQTDSTSTAATASISSNKTLLMGCQNSDIGGVRFYNDYSTVWYSIGDGLTDAEALAFYTIVQQFQTNLNRQINP